MKLWRCIVLTSSFICIINISIGQDINYARKVISKLTSPRFNGRGYVKEGDSKAANYIQKEFAQIGLKKFNKDYNQQFYFPVNSFPGSMCLHAGNMKLVPGVDFIVDPGSPSVRGKFVVKKLTDINDWYKPAMFNKTIVLIDLGLFNDSLKHVVRKFKNENHDFYGIIYLEEKKLTWSVATHQNTKFSFYILKDAWPKEAEQVEINIEAKFHPEYETQNVIGFIEGTVKDSFYVFTAHYDHLGKMGSKTIFPGANDNACGVSMLLNLARYYSNHKPAYSIAFIAFAGEEPGLIGSRYFTENPLFELTRIKFLLNFDVIGTGDEGIMVVNATEYSRQYELLENLNNEQHLLPSIAKRGKAANSDQYWFAEKGVPSFFIYTMGGIKAYHDVYDVASTLPLTEYSDLFKLIISFVAHNP